MRDFLYQTIFSKPNGMKSTGINLLWMYSETNNKPAVFKNFLEYLDYAINPSRYEKTPISSFTTPLVKILGRTLTLPKYTDSSVERLNEQEVLEIALLFVGEMSCFKGKYHDALDSFGIFVDYNNRNDGILLKKLLTSDSSNISREIFYSLFLLFSGITVGTHFETLNEFRLERGVIKNEQHYPKVQSVVYKKILLLWDECRNKNGRFYYASGSNVCLMVNPRSYKELCERLVYYFNDRELSVSTKEENRKPTEAIGGKETLFVFPFCGIFCALINMFIYVFLNDVIPFLTYFLPIFTFAFMIGAYEMIEELRKEISVPLSREIIISLRIYMIACIVFPTPFILIPLFVVASIFSCHMYVTLGKGVQ